MITFNFTPFPVLETERLTLRNVSVNDADEIFELRSNPEVGRYIERSPHADKAETLAWIDNIILKGLAENRSIQWAITLKGEPKLIGTACLWNLRPEAAEAELGYDLMPEHWGKGYMHEAIAAIIQYGFETLHLNLIDAYTLPENTASVKVLTRNGFVLTGKDTESPCVIFELEKDHIIAQKGM